MSDEDDMQPVTRKEFRDELAVFREELAVFRIELNQDIARHFTAALEQFRSWFGTLDDKYRDLPARVARLENEDVPTRLVRIEQHLFAPPSPPTQPRRAPKKRKRRAA
ncbi:hypothetical protein BH11MYX2_BH11MYX2_09380 [soil metagenome]